MWWNGRHQGLKIPCGRPRTGSSPVTGTRNGASERMSRFWCRTFGEVLSASLKRERGLPSPPALFPCKLDTRFGFELPRCTTSEFTPHGSGKAIAKAVAFPSSVLRGSSFPNRTRCAGLRFGYRFEFGLPRRTGKSAPRGALFPVPRLRRGFIRFAQLNGRGRGGKKLRSRPDPPLHFLLCRAKL